MASKSFLKHVALIPDGNRRWARRRGLQPWLGHQGGTKNLEKLLNKARELKIPYLTFWGASWDNLTKRTKIEVNFLFKLFTEQFERFLKERKDPKKDPQDEVKIRVFGRWREILPKKTQEVIKKVIEKTKNNNKYFLTFLLAYDGRDEMIECCQKIVNLAKNKALKATSDLIKQNLWTKDLPPVDLIIRTGCEGDPHNSAGFMMWDTAYSQLHFTKTLFPAFAPKEFEKIVNDYLGRERRLGK